MSEATDTTESAPAAPVAMRSIEWGLPVPAAACVTWGARAIYSCKTVMSRVSAAGRRLKFAQEVTHAEIDLLWDRKSSEGHPLEVKALCEWLDKRGLRELRKACEREYLTTDSEDSIEFEADGYKLVASPNGSYGYLYISAWKVV